MAPVRRCLSSGEMSALEHYDHMSRAEDIVRRCVEGGDATNVWACESGHQAEVLDMLALFGPLGRASP